MVLIVKMDGQENRVLARFEAWERYSMENAEEFMEKNNLEFVYDEINMNGDMVIWCK